MHAYSLLTRLADFVEPEQLLAWDEIRKPELVELVTRLASRRHKDRGAMGHNELSPKS